MDKLAGDGIIAASATTRPQIRPTALHRNADHDRTINSASGSLDKQFNAIEVKCRNGNKLRHWAHTLKEMRSGGIFSGGIDIRKTFVLIDT